MRKVRTRGGQPPGDAIPIARLLDELGYGSAEARAKARACMEAAGLTNPSKQNIHAAKREDVRRLLAATFIRTCDTTWCYDVASNDGRTRVRVPPKDCEVCGGSRQGAALERMLDQLRTNGCTRLLVVGGSPSTHEQLRRACAGAGVEVALVEGTRPTQPQRAAAQVRSADVIVIWGSTMLDHRVSAQFQRPEHAAKTVTVARRGLEALADAVFDHLAGRRSER